jgi:hypothetical protein
MKIAVRVKPKRQVQKIEKRDDIYQVWLRSVPEGGRANQELIALLSKHFNVAKSDVRIVAGKSSRNKIVKIG